MKREENLFMPIAPDLSPTLSDSQKINLNVITMNTAINDLQTDVRMLNKIVIEGNGELPLREAVRNHDAFIKSIQYWTKLVFGAMILQTVTFGAAILLSVIRFLPVLEKLASKP